VLRAVANVGVVNSALPLQSPRTLIDLLPRTSDRAVAVLRDIALVLGFAGLTAVLAQVKVHLGFTPVPITGQTLAVMLSGAVLGWKRGLLSQLAYLLIGLVVPFSWYAGKHGWKVASGTNGGYLVGFIVAAAVVGFLAERKQDRHFASSLSAMLLGTAIIYALGAVWLAHKLNVPVAKDNGGKNAIAYGVAPFLIGDAIKMLIAGAITPAAWKLLGRNKG
jgi:biotin transporter BioY